MTEKKRFHIIDTVRGFLLLHMIVYHALWDMVYIFGADIPWFGGTASNIWEKIGCSCFILVSGISWRISANTINKLKGGTVTLACGAVIMMATALVPAGGSVMFGILTFLGSCMLIMIPLHKLLKNCRCSVGAAVSLLLFALFWGTGEKNMAFGTVHLPEVLYRGGIMTFLGFPGSDFYSDDYFPLIPWIFMYLCGYFLSPAVVEACRKRPGKRVEPLTFMGRRSLVVYMLHQPIVYGLLMLVYGKR